MRVVRRFYTLVRREYTSSVVQGNPP